MTSSAGWRLAVEARQHYDLASVGSLVDEVLPDKADREQARELLRRRQDLVKSLWSAKIVGRKPD